MGYEGEETAGVDADGSGGEIFVGITFGALDKGADIGCGNSKLAQFLNDGGGEIDVRFLVALYYYIRCIRKVFGKNLSHFRTDFKTCRAYRGPHDGYNFIGLGSEGGHGSEGIREKIVDYSAPAAMGSGDNATCGMGEQHRHTIGCVNG